MDKRTTLLGSVAQAATIYGITTGLLNIFCLLFGDKAVGYSNMFSLGGQGISVATSLQFLLVSVIVMLLRKLFMTDILIKDMTLSVRITLMFTSVFAVMVAFVAIFGWFPVSDIVAWIMFIVCFAVSCAVSVAISTTAVRKEDERLEEALKRLKEEK